MTTVESLPGASALSKLSSSAFSQLFPDNCRVCDLPLRNISRVPVCLNCLNLPAPLVAEYSCSCCRAPFLNSFPLDEKGRCGLCRLGLNRFDAAYAFGAYEGALRKLIHLFKYSGVRTLARPLGAKLALALPPGESFDVIVPAPLHWMRWLQRGFNQSNLLARELQRRVRVPIVRALRRLRMTRVQAGLSRAGRRANVAGAFRARKSAGVRNRRVLLVDDVLTTGATANACAATLKRAGALHITVLTLARADRRSVLPAFEITAAVASSGAL